MPNSNFQRRATRKQQSRLVFDPIESASAPASSMSPARLRYANTRAKASRTTTREDKDVDETDGTLSNDMANSTRSKDDIAKSLPSPEKSSQLSKKPDIKERLDFEPDFDSSDSDDIVITSSRKLILTPSKSSATRTKKSIPKARHAAKLNDSSESSESEVEVEKKNPTSSFISEGTSYNVPKSSSGRRTSFPKAKGSTPITSSGRRRSRGNMDTTPSKRSNELESGDVISSSESNDEGEADVGMPTPKPTQTSSATSKKVASSAISSRRSRRVVISDDEDGDDEPNDSDDSLPSFSQIKKVKPNEPAVDDDDDDDVVSSPTKKRRTLLKSLDFDEDDENEEADVVSSPLKRKRVVQEDSDDNDLEIVPSSPTKKGKAKQKASAHSDEEVYVVSSPLKRRRIVQVDSDSDLEIVPSSPSKKGKGKQKASSDSDEESASMKASPTKKRKLLHRKKSTTAEAKKPKRTPAQKKLELLRRRRAGEKIDALTDSEPEEHGRALYDSASELEALSNFDDEESEEEIAKAKKPRKKKGREGEEEDDFVVDDDDEEVGVPGEFGMHDIPLEFTHAAHKRKKEHFKDAVEWMVQRKINPAFNRKDPVYRLAFRKLDDELKGYAQSNYASSVWREGFTRALFARPIFLEEHTGVQLDERKCDACNRSKHPATFKVSFGGNAYYKETLEDVDNDPDSDEDSDAHQDVNEDGVAIPDVDEEYYLGSVCKTNAEMAHALTHWKHALNEWVVDQLKAERLLTPGKLAAREEMNIKQRSKIAEKIVDTWERSGEIKQLYNLLKAQLETASQGPKRGRWGR